MDFVSEKPKPVRLGRDSITLRTQESNYIPVISDIPYVTRTQAKAWLAYKGARPIHRTTLQLDRTRHKLDYVTLYKHYHRGNPKLSGVRRPPTCPSLFTSQWEIGENNERCFNTNHNVMFPPKTGESISLMRDVQVRNRVSNTHGLRMVDVTHHDEGASYFTSYRNSHDALGQSRGRGVPHVRKKPPVFNIISGEISAPTSGRIDHRLRSGNRVLSEQRRRSNIYQTFQLG
nr:uncharacterized protein LOC100184141 [Ciona intestinalis]|eukprot:XP_002127562.1 uncharacterized protein LOC100184141 [Ciona intestinalis]